MWCLIRVLRQQTRLHVTHLRATYPVVLLFDDAVFFFFGERSNLLLNLFKLTDGDIEVVRFFIIMFSFLSSGLGAVSPCRNLRRWIMISRAGQVATYLTLQSMSFSTQEGACETSHAGRHWPPNTWLAPTLETP